LACQGWGGNVPQHARLLTLYSEKFQGERECPFVFLYQQKSKTEKNGKDRNQKAKPNVINILRESTENRHWLACRLDKVMPIPA
jgi:hypothetical protein